MLDQRLNDKSTLNDLSIVVLLASGGEVWNPARLEREAAT